MALHLGSLEISSFIRAHQWSIPITALRVWAKAFYPEGVYVCVCASTVPPATDQTIQSYLVKFVQM